MKKSLILLILLVAISILAVVIPSVPSKIVTEGINSGDVAWMLAASALVLLMTPGLAFFYGGMIDVKNIIATMLQSFIAMGVISVLWIVVGFSLAFGEDMGGGLIGNPASYFMFQNVLEAPAFGTIPLVLFAFFQLKFAIITPALITGTFAERIRFKSYIVFIVLFSLLIYAPLAHWTWHADGFLYKMGVLDFAGGTVVHMSAGFAALAASMYLRNKNEVKTHISPANIPFVLLGTGLLWFGWFGFNAGSSLSAGPLAALAFATTNTASAAAGLAWILFDAVRGKKPSALGFCIGAVVGLVAITPAAGLCYYSFQLVYRHVCCPYQQRSGTLEIEDIARRYVGRVPLPRCGWSSWYDHDELTGQPGCKRPQHNRQRSVLWRVETVPGTHDRACNRNSIQLLRSAYTPEAYRPYIAPYHLG